MIYQHLLKEEFYPPPPPQPGFLGWLAIPSGNIPFNRLGDKEQTACLSKIDYKTDYICTVIFRCSLRALACFCLSFIASDPVTSVTVFFCLKTQLNNIDQQ